MSSDLEQALQRVISSSSAPRQTKKLVRSLARAVESIGCRNIAAKIDEFYCKRLEDLCAELRLAQALSVHLGGPLDFQTGDAPDLRFSKGDVDCLVEVIHKSSSSPFVAVFCPDPVDLDSYAQGPSWRQKAIRLHEVLAGLAVEIQPWIDGRLVQPYPDWAQRSKQENECGDLADWLASELLRGVPRGKSKLRHPNGLAQFDLRTIRSPPGQMKGYGPLNAPWFVTDALRHSLESKSKKAKRRLGVAGADCYLIALAIDDAFLSDGHQLLRELLGHVVVRCVAANQHHAFRSVPVDGKRQFEAALRLGRGHMLDSAQFEPGENCLYNNLPGVYFDVAYANVSGVVALYYTGALQFVPNPFSPTKVEKISHFFPQLFNPFYPDERTAAHR